MDQSLRRVQRRYYSDPSIENAERYIRALERAQGAESPSEIQTMLVVSSSHIPMEEGVWLNENQQRDQAGDWNGLVWAENEYGWVIWIADDELFEQRIVGYPPNLANLMRLAKNLDCDFLRLDSDGPVYENLLVWDW